MNWLLAFFYRNVKAFVIAGASAIGGGSIAVPALAAGNRFEDYLFREFNPTPAEYDYARKDIKQVSTSGNQFVEDHSELLKKDPIKHSNAQLIKGTKAYNGGNYVIYFGSEACPNCNNFLYSDNESPRNWLGSDQRNLYGNGIFFETYSLAHHRKDIRGLSGVKFIFFSDVIPSMGNRNNDDLHQIPWTKWPSTLISRGSVEGDYIRNDESAVNFRKLNSLFHYYFGSKINGIPTIIIYKNGIPFVYNSDKLDDLEAEKAKTGEKISSIHEAEFDTSSKAAILRYDLFKHLQYIYESKVSWWY